MRTYIALMFEVTAVVCLIAAVVVVTDIFWAKSSLPSAQPTQLSQPHKTQKSPATAEGSGRFHLEVGPEQRPLWARMRHSSSFSLRSSRRISSKRPSILKSA
jgi:hypothetical protein